MAEYLGSAEALLNPNKVEDPDYKAQIAGRDLSDSEVLQVLHRFPDLLKKPIVFSGETAVTGYDPARLEAVVKRA